MSIKKEIKYFIIRHFLTFFAYYALSLYTKTIRVKLENEEMLKEHLKYNGRVLVYSWHQRFFGGFYLSREFDQSPCIMISQSRDGDFIADVVKRIGWIPTRGSSSRGGKKALEEMITGIIENRLGAHIVDGPTGPPRIIKPGLVILAQKTGTPICPGLISYENPWIFNSWDRFMVPKPFSKVLIRFGTLEFIPEDMDTDQFEAVRLSIEKNLIEGYKEVDSYWKKN
jgi:lysophospholipid acyltransferase (LPLAT)-like uncharacterized protein